MDLLEMIPLKPCPFCGADAEMKWTMHEKFGKTMRVACSRDGECPSPSWEEYCEEYETDAECLESVSRFWNTRAEDWAADDLIRLRVKLSKAERDLRVITAERDRAQKACEQIAENCRP